MSLKVSLRELEQQLPTLLEMVAKDGAECVVQRNGKDYAVIISVQEWRRRSLG
jgi:prevent-host-death family protein